MNKEAEKTLTKILEKEPAALTQFEVAFLNARRSYLSDDQIEYYASVLRKTNPKKKRSYKELQKQAAKRGINPVGKSREQLEKILSK